MYYLYSNMTNNITNLDMNCTGVNNTLSIGSNCFSKTQTYNTTVLEGLNFQIQFVNQTNNNYLILPLLSLSGNNTSEGLGVYMFDQYPVNAIIIGQPFYNSFLA